MMARIRVVAQNKQEARRDDNRREASRADNRLEARRAN